MLRFFINGSRESLDPYLIQIVQTLLKCLDPNDEQLRKNSTSLVSSILSTMVKTSPNIAFHHETQRLAVGTPNGPIAIYDVRTSAKWKILEGHTKAVSCVEFEEKGNLLASYSATDLTLRLWKVGNAGFFSAIMSGTGKSAKDIKLKPLPGADHPEVKPSKARSFSEVEEHKSSVKHRCKLSFANGDKAVELTREDGSVEFHRL